MRSNSVNIILPFTSRTRDSYQTQFYNRNDGAFIRVSVFGKEEHLKEASLLVKSFAEKVLDLLPEYWPIEE
jgi:CO/xanthine dehydrogenase FAD-binding subunit